MAANYIYLLPIVIFVWFPATFVVTYILAVVRKDVNPLFPYISDTGTFSPESCIFGQMLNTGAILMGLFVYVRHRQVRELCERNVLGENILRKNRLSSWFGYSAAFGVTIVGNFQETNILLVHMIGAFLAFGLGTVWECFQTWISFQLFPSVGNKTTNTVRLTVSIICSICFTISFVFAGLALMKFEGDDITKWNQQDGGYEFHLTSTITEWIVVISTMGYILSYSSEMRNVRFDEPLIKIWEKEANHSDNTISPESAHSSRADTPSRY